VHLQGLHEKILGVAAIRTRQRQMDTPFAPKKKPGRDRVYPIPIQAYRILTLILAAPSAAEMASA
jgi:hypothetical protein